MADQRLLDLLCRAGRIDAATVPTVERAMADRGLSAIEVLIENDVLSEIEIARSLAAELKLPFVDLQSAPADASGARLVDRAKAQHYELVPYRSTAAGLTIAMANPLDREALGLLAGSKGLEVQAVVATRSQVLEAIRRLYRNEASVGALLANVPAATDLEVVRDPARSVAPSDLDAASRESEQAPIIKLVNLILLEAFEAGVSDVHVEPGPNLLLVRFRIDGILEDHLQIPKWAQSSVTARIKVMAKLDITERRLPQDGHFTIRVRDRLADIRVSSMPTSYGEKVVFRLLDPSSSVRQLSEIGLSPSDLSKVRRVIQRPEGIILVTGPTGSGKTTTLYAVIQELLSREINIVTIEDPVEYELAGVSQIPVNSKQGLTFATVLRSILRQDPDVILVGEIRDRETAEIAFQAAQTGHLVLSTLHTNDSVGAVTRLLDLGLDPQVVGPSLLAVVAQRLVRKVCAACAEPTEVDEATRQAIAVGRGATLRRGRGCPACRNTGFAGRTACYEILTVTKGIQRLIQSNAGDGALRTLAEDEGMTSLVDDARSKIESGLTTPSEVLRVVEMEELGPSCPSCGNPIEASFTVCPYCQSVLRLTCAACGEALKKKWTSCPACGTAVSPSPAAPLPLPAARPPGGDLGGFETPRLLVVDDDRMTLLLARKALTAGEPPLQVDTAISGEEALSKISAQPPHIVLLDLMMPGIDGVEVCKRLRADLKTALIPVMMVTTRDDPETRQLAFLTGTDDYVVKPFEGGELLTRVHRLLKRTYGWSPVKADHGTGSASREAD